MYLPNAKHLKAKQTINFITMVFNSNSPNTLLFTEYVGKTVAMSVFLCSSGYICIYIGFFFSQISSITKTHVFLPLKEKVGSGAGKKGFFSANSAPAPNAAQSIHNVLVCCVWHCFQNLPALGSWLSCISKDVHLLVLIKAK